ncbi:MULTISPECIES: YeeE/YedE thiosulfate transporter family protein [Cylindrospermopsis]|uniref:YeeE/YedE thiosulfate transporter family protein n=1 Tax=Cylindrospermopsis TaxID=77021 RepID=UPI000710D49C|nr:MULTISPECIES: YeeE/YedE thiosulfate transporter family protein [Cylindrospermopsis]KRH95396.1 hypothetical protein ASL19_12095 [Cylindrospermopsis sp. CR12]
MKTYTQPEKLIVAIAPIGVSGVIGAFIFGIGMQLGGACGCGTLYTISSGNYTMIITRKSPKGTEATWL